MSKIKEFINNPNFKPIIQFAKFGIVGTSSTIITLVIDNFCYYVVFSAIDNEPLRGWISTLIAFVISVTNSYYWNNKFVFSQGKKTAKQHIYTYLKTFISYGLTGIVINGFIKHLLIGKIDYFLLSFGVIAINVPLNYVLNKFWAFKKTGK